VKNKTVNIDKRCHLQRADMFLLRKSEIKTLYYGLRRKTLIPHNNETFGH
jgi:hypothetical protein